MAPPAPHALPVELTSFVGRRAEMAELRRVLATSRLVTLTGPGGVGKTRLALRAAGDAAARFRDGIALVELANVGDPRLVAEAVGAALGAHGQPAQWSAATLAEYLTGQRLLLILDNCEHVLDEAAPLAGTLLRACPDLRILATSRQALGIGGETVVAVPPMAVPLADGSPPTVSDAVELFLERASPPGAGGPMFDDGARPRIEELCRRLDGIPLALELAAVRVRALGLDAVVASLDRQAAAALGSGDRSAPPRQRTLESAIDWSYQLLAGPERELWLRLSVFAGGFELDAAQRVCADEDLPPDAIPGLLASLVERSLVARETRAGRARFRILEVLRAMARDRLEASGKAADLGRRHAAWIADLAADIGANDARQAALFTRARAERANIWAALQHGVAHPEDAARGIATCRDLWAFWHCARPVSEIVRLLEALIEHVPEGSRAHATGTWVAASLLAAQRDLLEAEEMAQRGLALGRAIGDAEVVEWSTIARCHIRWYDARWAEADEVAADALALARLMEMPFALVVGLYTVATTKYSTGDFVASEVAAAEALARSEQLGETWLRSYVMNLIGRIVLDRGDLGEAERLARTCLTLRRELGDGVGMRHSIELLVAIEAARRSWEGAALLAGAAEAVWRAIAGRAVRVATPAFQASLVAIREALGGRAFDAAYARGLALTMDDAVEVALAPERGTARPTSPPARRPTGPLSPRELEVARLIADGASNGETAARLFISERTVETHVANILNKLGLTSRVQVARWVAALDAPEG